MIILDKEREEVFATAEDIGLVENCIKVLEPYYSCYRDRVVVSFNSRTITGFHTEIYDEEIDTLLSKYPDKIILSRFEILDGG